MPLKKKTIGWRRIFTTTRLKKRRAPADMAYDRYKTEARAFIVSRTQELAEVHGFTLKRIAIKNQRRSWGSCSALGNLNFSYKLLFLPRCLCDYIIVHELSHLRELNHSQRYWEVVESLMPDYKNRLAELRRFEHEQGTSLRSLTILKARHEHCKNCLSAFGGLKETTNADVVIDEPTEMSRSVGFMEV